VSFRGSVGTPEFHSSACGLWATVHSWEVEAEQKIAYETVEAGCPVRKQTSSSRVSANCDEPWLIAIKK
jgi:hypothetical protein